MHFSTDINRPNREKNSKIVKKFACCFWSKFSTSGQKCAHSLVYLHSMICQLCGGKSKTEEASWMLRKVEFCREVGFCQNMLFRSYGLHSSYMCNIFKSVVLQSVSNVWFENVAHVECLCALSSQWKENDDFLFRLQTNGSNAIIWVLMYDYRK